MKRFFNWLANKIAPQTAAPRVDVSRTGDHLRQSGRHAHPHPVQRRKTASARDSELVELDPHIQGQIEDSGPGKNVLIRNKFVRRDSGTHETLTILDDSLLESDDENGIDPYNTGQFDRSKNWDKRFRN